MWTRKQGQTVESALIENNSCELVLRAEPQGEGLAIKHDKTGFYTISEMAGEEKGKNDVPFNYYPFW